MSVLAVMRSLKSEVDAGSIKPYCFVEINGLKLASPENIYSVRLHDNFFYFAVSNECHFCSLIEVVSFFFQVIYEGLTGHRVGWKKALNFLNARFSNENKSAKDTRPCILLIDELDLLVTRNQAVRCAFT